jgi:ribosomal protein S18 acetylase RimI-like enzyme
MNLIQRKAQITDLKAIVALLADDKLGHSREQSSNDLSQQYIDAFNAINKDPNQYLIVLCIGTKIIGTCHCTLMPSPTFTGSTRMQIEAVRVHSDVRGQNIGQQMMELAMSWGKEHGAKIVQLTTNKERPEALRFYEKLGFKASHAGMKLYLD